MLIEAFVNPRQALPRVVQRFIAEKILDRTFESGDELVAVVQAWPAFAAECLGVDHPFAVHSNMVVVLDSVDPCIKWTGKLGQVAYLHEVVRIADQGLKCKFFNLDSDGPCHHPATCVVVLGTARDSMRPSCKDHEDAEWNQPTQSILTTLDPKLLPRS